MRKTRDRELLKSIFLLVIVIAICCIFFEAAVRLFWQEPGAGYPDGLFLPDKERGFSYRPGFNGTFLSRQYSNITISINSHGLRDSEHSYSKAPGVTRILAVGDSVTFGAGVPVEDTYIKQLERKLNDNGYRIETINMGVNKYEFGQELIYYEEEGRKYHPDIVMIGIVLNDAREPGSGNYYQEYLKGEVGRFCKSCKLLAAAAEDISIGGMQNYNEVYFRKILALWNSSSLGAYRNRLEELKRSADEDGSKLVLVIFPYTEQFNASSSYMRQPQDSILEISDELNATAIDLLPLLDRADYRQYYLQDDDVHLNGKGYKLVSDFIYDRLIEKKVIAK